MLNQCVCTCMGGWALLRIVRTLLLPLAASVVCLLITNIPITYNNYMFCVTSLSDQSRWCQACSTDPNCMQLQAVYSLQSAENRCQKVIAC
jgi:hypothetical protein